MLRHALLLCAALAAACQGPPADVHAVHSAASPVVPLERSLAPLEAAFDGHADEARVVVLLPARCEQCACGLRAVRESILEAFPEARLHVLLVFPGGERCDACGAPVLHELGSARVTLFRDADGIAARAFARGLLPVAEARDMFLFYPRGMRWHDAPLAPSDTSAAARAAAPAGGAPRADQWWHRLGRIAPERHCATQELDQTLRQTVEALLAGPPSVAQR